MNRTLNVVAIGGGTGLPRLLESLRPLIVDGSEENPPSWGISNLTAVVAVTDNGGSSGRLRAEFGILPPGDIRNCLVALSDAGEHLRKLFQYRFEGSEGLAGHAFGNLFIAALTHVQGDVMQALASCHEILNIKGRILPASTSDLHLRALMTDGRWVQGEDAIGRSGGPIRRLELSEPDPPAVDEACEIIEHADLIILGPGSLYTSLLPNLLVPGIARAVARNRGHIIYIANLMTQPQETGPLSLGQHLDAMISHLPSLRIDTVVLHQGEHSPELLQHYQADGAEPLVLEGLFYNTIRLHRAPLVAPGAKELKHDPDLLRKAVGQVMVSLSEGISS